MVLHRFGFLDQGGQDMYQDRGRQLDRAVLVEEVIKRLGERLGQELPEGDATLDELEEVVGRIGNDVTKDLLERLVRERTGGARENRTECSCGEWALYKGQRRRTIVTVHGVTTFERACYYCRSCRKVMAPYDSLLGLDAGTTTRQVRIWACWLGAQLPFAQAATTMELLTRVSISAATMERISVCAGASLRQAEQEKARQHQEERLPDQRWQGSRPRRLYVSMDGTMVPVREDWKKDGSQGDLVCRWAECKTGVVYETEQDQSGRDARVKRSAYTATLGSVEHFEPLLGTLAHRNGHHQTKEMVVVADGAPWIWNVAGRQFPKAVQIIDFWHVCEHISAVADARFGKESVLGREWQNERKKQLKTDQVETVVRAIQEWRPTNPKKQELRRTTIAYLLNNAHRMRYKTFLERGYHIGSGVGEAACKRVVAQRLDQSGMHWLPKCAEPILALRAAQLSGKPTDLREHCKSMQA
jgi:hypothetical protein